MFDNDLMEYKCNNLDMAELAVGLVYRRILVLLLKQMLVSLDCPKTVNYVWIESHFKRNIEAFVTVTDNK